MFTRLPPLREVKPLLKNTLLTVLFIGLLGVLTGPWPTKEAEAAKCCKPNPMCTVVQNMLSRQLETILHDLLREHITQEFIKQERWFMYDYFFQYILPGLMQMVEQTSAVAQAQVFTFGAIMDAKEQLETQRLLSEKVAEAHRDYRPDINMCTIGSVARGLAAQDRDGESVANTLSKRMIDRQMGVRYSVGSAGMTSDTKARIEQFRKSFCDRNSNGGNTSNICLTGTSAHQVNKDINYTDTIGVPRSVSMLDMNQGMLTSGNNSIFALATNLYGHRTFEKSRTPSSNMEGDDGRISGEMSWYLDKRAITAKRSVAQNTFNKIAGMKANPINQVNRPRNELRAIFDQLGVNTFDVATKVDFEKTSHYAQLEAMAQKIYQTPAFFTNLYDSPTNVLRKNVAMQAINLMLDRETYLSELRTEALLSQLLEAELVRYQKSLSNRMNQMSNQSAPGTQP